MDLNLNLTLNVIFFKHGRSIRYNNSNKNYNLHDLYIHDLKKLKVNIEKIKRFCFT